MKKPVDILPKSPLTASHLRIPPVGVFVYDTIVELGPQSQAFVTTDTITRKQDLLTLESQAVGEAQALTDTIVLNCPTLRLRTRKARQGDALIDVAYDASYFTISRKLLHGESTTQRVEETLLLDGALESYMLSPTAMITGEVYSLRRYDAQTDRVDDYRVIALQPMRLEQHPLKPEVIPIEVRTIRPSAEFVCYYIEVAIPHRIIHTDSVSPVGGATMRSTLRLN